MKKSESSVSSDECMFGLFDSDDSDSSGQKHRKEKEEPSSDNVGFGNLFGDDEEEVEEVKKDVDSNIAPKRKKEEKKEDQSDQDIGLFSMFDDTQLSETNAAAQQTKLTSKTGSKYLMY